MHERYQMNELICWLVKPTHNRGMSAVQDWWWLAQCPVCLKFYMRSLHATNRKQLPILCGWYNYTLNVWLHGLNTFLKKSSHEVPKFRQFECIIIINSKLPIMCWCGDIKEQNQSTVPLSFNEAQAQILFLCFRILVSPTFLSVCCVGQMNLCLPEGCLVTLCLSAECGDMCLSGCHS